MFNIVERIIEGFARNGTISVFPMLVVVDGRRGCIDGGREMLSIILGVHVASFFDATIRFEKEVGIELLKGCASLASCNS